MNRPSTGMRRSVAGHGVAQAERPRPSSSPRTSSTAVLVWISILGLACARSTMIRLRPERVAAVEQVDLRREAGQERRLLEARCRRRRRPRSPGRGRRTRRRSRRRDTPRPRSRVSLSRPSHSADAPVATITDWAAVLDAARPQPERPLGEVDAVDVDVDDLGPEALRLGAERGHQVGALDAVGEARVVLDVAGEHQLAAGRRTGEHDRLEVGPRRVDRGGQPGRAGADDEELRLVRPWPRSAAGCRRPVAATARRRRRAVGRRRRRRMSPLKSIVKPPNGLAS